MGLVVDPSEVTDVGPGGPRTEDQTAGGGHLAPQATLAEHYTFLFFTLWTLFGLGLDGWAHTTRPELESFFTPWHAVFYAGFMGSVFWLGWMVIRRRPDAPSLRGAIPEGYQLAAVGLGIFALGGFSDSIWHTVFGIEESIDALLSPPHLVLLTGSLAGSSAPARALWRTYPGRTGPLADLLPALASAGVVVTSLGFFFLYGNGFDPWQMTEIYEPGEIGEMFAAYGVLSTVTTSVLLVGGALVVLRRWSPPFGGYVVLFSIYGVFVTGVDAFAHWWQILPAFLGGLVADVVVFECSRRGKGLTTTARTLALAVPLAMWTSMTLLTVIFWDVVWPIELWAGQIVIATMVSGLLSLLSHPPARPEAGHRSLVTNG